MKAPAKYVPGSKMPPYADMSDEEFDRSLGQAIDEIYAASIA